ncbi:similar to Saccharomyces cerevisiae YKR056W TRM2 tRNA methyltransferase [Maudiozyma saulgeensis]|uniref:tRNA (uracil(54)-C(5))-methyltransferase n=1 Tax=Maudiozyma saulgeensis TaxID=1789683 RepID=A0A1X7R1K8_9SACH|nr:similar to Saccharomyces cerevisiae YKR056W TRM2 tRNA methyltransferase [Kazachstania saulgeensis]
MNNLIKNSFFTFIKPLTPSVTQIPTRLHLSIMSSINNEIPTATPINKRAQEVSPLPKVKKQKLKRYKAKKADPTSPSGVLQFEIDDLLKTHNLTRDEVSNDISAILNDFSRDDENSITHKYHRIVNDVEILTLTSSGDGLALIDNPVEQTKKQIAIVPFGLPGDVTNIRVFKTHPHYVETDLLDVNKKSPIRRDDLIKDKYFGKASGSQFEFLTYEKQLEIKKHTITNAYKYFAPRLMGEGLLPTTGTTIASPLQYNYRTKITPHFDMPRKVKVLEERPPLGFGQKGRPTWRKDTLEVGGHSSTLDIDSCALATDILNTGLTNERRKFNTEYKNYKKGATILLRENTIVLDESKDIKEQLGEGSRDENGEVSYVELEDKEHGVKLIKTCVTNQRQIVAEYVDGYTFNFTAGEFFQNNNSILPIVTKYVRENLQIPNSKADEPNYLVDAYCGSGLFSVCSSKGVDKVTGVEISADSVSFAEKNAKTNGIKNCDFIVGKAEKLFESISTPNDRTSVILDPPRKGCDEVFMKQLADYYPARIVYISCNVHSQARDIEYFIKETEKGSHYKIESLRGFDFFPQTHHVESVCVLSRV